MCIHFLDIFHLAPQFQFNKYHLLFCTPRLPVPAVGFDDVSVAVGFTRCFLFLLLFLRSFSISALLRRGVCFVLTILFYCSRLDLSHLDLHCDVNKPILIILSSSIWYPVDFLAGTDQREQIRSRYNNNMLKRALEGEPEEPAGDMEMPLVCVCICLSVCLFMSVCMS